MNIKLNGNQFFRVTANYGEIDSVHTTAHTGIDLSMATGTKLYSPVNGYIESTPDYGAVNCGRTVIIRTDEGERVILGHLSENHIVHAGQRVHVGDYVAISGNSGKSTGSHLHVGLRDQNNNFVNPSKLFNGNEIVSKPIPEVHTTHLSEVLQSSLSSLAEALAKRSLNVIHIVFNSSAFDLILETICTMLCI